MSSANKLLSRVTLITIGIALLASLVGASTAAVLAQRFLLSNLDIRLTQAAQAFLDEVHDDATLQAEGAELLPLQLRWAYDDGRMHGDAKLRSLRGCSSLLLEGRQFRACGIQANERSVAVAHDLAELSERRNTFILASALAALLAVLLATAISRTLSSWAVRPFVQAHEAVLVHSQHFAQDAAHELRTPVTAIRAELELMAESGTLGEQDAAAIARVLRRTSDMQGLLERLLILATQGHIELHEAIDLKRVAESVGLATVTGTSAVVRGDASLLLVMITNAIDNALKFSDGGVVTITCAARAGWAIVEIHDEGVGVASEFRKHVFEPFFRTPDARASGKQGFGLGLALIAHVVQVHAGHVQFLDVPRGATLQLRIPLLA